MFDCSSVIVAVLLLIWTPSEISAGSCRGDGVFDGDGTFNGEGIFASEAGTFEGTGTFIGSDGASFQGSGACEFNARVQSVDESTINVTGSGAFNGRGRFEVQGVTFDGDGVVEGENVTFVGVGTFEGEGTVEEGGAVNVFGDSFECTGAGILAGSGSFEGEGSMQAPGTFMGRGSFNGSGSLVGTGSCNGTDVNFNDMSGTPSTESDTDEVDEEAIEADV